MSVTAELLRVQLHVRGAVQGVGFRPFVYRLARELQLGGWVGNDSAGVVMEVEGDGAAIDAFIAALQERAPPRARIHDVHREARQPVGTAGFEIVASDAAGVPSAVVLPDLATCDDCAREIRAAADRRAGYAFTNCTNCGPRFSIVRALPYDRRNTTMAGFRMCAACAAEYGDPLDRRFHAQPNACPVCGPRLELLDAHGRRLGTADPLGDVAAALNGGAVVAVKGLGGFHLMCDARSEDAVQTLRTRKRRPSKPLALLARDVAQARRFVTVDAAAASILASPECPIVLLPRWVGSLLGLGGEPSIAIAPAVAPGQSRLGVMLPAMPLHHLLMDRIDFPLVATSGNLSEEPICTTEHEALTRLGGIADLFLVHDRPIERHVDDSVADVVDGAPLILRRARGYAPMPVLLPAELPPILAVGPHLKNTIALSRGRQVFLSQHIGDLETHEAQLAFDRVIADFLRLYEVEPVAIARDAHPTYISTFRARCLSERLGVPVIAVQHHHAHLASCLADNACGEDALGVIWDGTGYGSDGTIWGGEFLLGDAGGYERVAHLLPFRLPGGDAAVREPRRVAAALLYEAYGADALCGEPALSGFTDVEVQLLRHMLGRGINAPVTSSAGRLLDGLAALLGLAPVASYEGEAAILLEQVADSSDHGGYDMERIPPGAAVAATVLDWRPLVRQVLSDRRRGVGVATIAVRIHNALVAALVVQAELAGCPRVALSGGCFQNRLLVERSAAALRRRGFDVLLHRQVPPNDGGIALGQVVAAAARLDRVHPLSER